MSQQELAQNAQISIDTVRKIEQEQILVPGIFMAADLVHALDGSLDSWLANTENKKSKKKKGWGDQ